METQPYRILLLRGLAREFRHWGRFPRLLTQAAWVHDVVGLDIPGSGTERHRTALPTIGQVVDDLRLRWVPLKEQDQAPWLILAISLGGMIALDWLSRFYEDFQGAVLINSSAGGLSPFYHRLQPGIYTDFLSLFAKRNPEQREQTLVRITSNRQDRWPEVTREWTSIAQTQPMSPLNVIRQLMSAASFQVPPHVAAPLLLLRSDADRMVHPQCSVDLAQHFGVPLRTHSGGGHDLSVDAPEWVVQQVEDWIQTRLWEQPGATMHEGDSAVED